MPRADFYKAALERKANAELRQRCRRLKKALNDLANDVHSMAQNSFSELGKFTEEMWKKADPEGYRFWKAAKDVLKR